MYRVSIGRIAFALCLGLVGCASPDENADDDQSIIVTKHAQDADFSKYTTFFLRGEIMTIDDEGEKVPLAENIATPLLETTSRNLEARGYTAAADKTTAELGVEMMYLDHVNTTYWCYSWWDPYYWGYPGWGYYPYYGWCDGAVWKSGALVTVITDLTVTTDTDPDAGAGGAGGGIGRLVPGIWFSGVYAVSLSTQQARDGIDQAFIQSPYVTNE